MLDLNLTLSNPFKSGFGKNIISKDFRVTETTSCEFQLNGFDWSLMTGISLNITSFKDMHRGFSIYVYLFGGLAGFVYYDNRHEY